MAHSNIGPSQAARILACPGSVKLIEKYNLVGETSKYSTEGTEAHAVAEVICLDKPIPDYATPEMIEGGKIYAGFIDSESDFGSCELHFEDKLSAPDLHPDFRGIVDCWFITADSTLHVIDYKFGEGVLVGAQNNTQLLYYALLVGETYKFPINKLRLSIVQPRLQNIQTWECDPEEVAEFLITFENALSRDDLNITDKCQFCPAKAICPEQIRVISDKFQDVTKPIDLPKIPDIPRTDIKTYLENAELLKSWISAVEKYAYSLLMQGEHIEGYDLKETLGKRKWIGGEEAAKAALLKLYPSNLICDINLKSITELDKLTNKEAIDALCERPKNKTLVRTDESKQTIDYFTKQGE